MRGTTHALRFLIQLSVVQGASPLALRLRGGVDTSPAIHIWQFRAVAVRWVLIWLGDMSDFPRSDGAQIASLRRSMAVLRSTMIPKTDLSISPTIMLVGTGE